MKKETAVFVSWSEQRAYRLLSLARNAGLRVITADIPRYVKFSNGTECPYKSIVEIECTREQFEQLREGLTPAPPEG